MEGAVRVFAGDFSRAECSMPGYRHPSTSYVLTPGGAWCNRVFVAGALTERTSLGSAIRCRLADPTGAFSLEIAREGRTDLPGFIEKIPIPAFLAVTGKAWLAKGDGRCVPVIRPDTMQVIDRPVRDLWVVKTADWTLRRAGALAAALNGEEATYEVSTVIEKYHTTPEQILEFLAMAEFALSGLVTETTASLAPEKDPRMIIIEIIGNLQGSRGVPADDVIAQARILGISTEAAQEVIASLIREDECYQPQKGSLRLL